MTQCCPAVPESSSLCCSEQHQQDCEACVPQAEMNAAHDNVETIPPVKFFQHQSEALVQGVSAQQASAAPVNSSR